VSTLDRAALRQGASVSLVFAVPFSIGARLAADSARGDSQGSNPWALLLSLAALAGFTLGAGVAAWAQTKRLPLLHGMVCAGGTYLAAQAVFVTVKLVRGGDVSWLGVFFTFTAVLFAGLVGGMLGSVMRKRGILPSSERSSEPSIATYGETTTEMNGEQP
jgi:hypothetical protein